MDPGRLFQIITNSTLLATRLLPAGRTSSLHFSSPRYCAAVPEDLSPGAAVLAVSATHAQGVDVSYSITGGNEQGLFSVHPRSGTVSLAGALDHELCEKHELEVTAESGSEAAVSVVLVKVVDVNDNPPTFLQPEPRVLLVEEDDRDLPATIARVEAVDADECDAGRLVYRVGGDGAGQPSDGEGAFFTINARTGDLIQLKALDRDPPQGRGVWRLRVEVHDGQWADGGGGGDDAATAIPYHYSRSHPHLQASWGHREPGPDPSPTEETKGIGRGHHGRRKRDPGPDPSPAEPKGTGRDSGQGCHGRRKRGVSHPMNGSVLLSDAETQGSRETIVQRKNTEQKGKMKGYAWERLKSISDGKRPGTGFPKQHKLQKPVTMGEKAHGGKGLSGCSEDVAYTINNQIHIFSSGHASESSLGARHAEVPCNPGRMTDGVQTRQWEERLKDGDGGHLTPVTEEAHTTSGVRELQTLLMPVVDDAHEVTGQRTRRGWPFIEKVKGRNLRPQEGERQLAALPSPRAHDYAATSQTTTSKDGLTPATPPLTAEMGYGQQGDISKSQTRASQSIKHSFVGRSSPYVYVDRVHRDVSRYSTDTQAAEDGECDAGVTYCASGGGGRVHVVGTVVTVVVKDINDNAPVFLNDTVVGSVPENAAAGTPVVMVTARDADDAEDGSNARLIYDIEKNVVVEASGAALFSVEPHTGLITTTRCCLDREETPEYRLQGM
ncbi:protocadherin-16-like [Eriocheir sinensis]|uniref:protocadherin-16-like n=1 Tax=Eriocheir sinensis TaxID=95602 RepID=UPI0021C61449|nr:protocadherin-16-like [Eriocheir sinensis]